MTATLLTGASGFIGRRALDQLVARGEEVVAVCRKPPQGTAGSIWRAVDLLEPGAAQALVRSVRPKRLLHLAWNAVPGAFWTAPDNLDWAASTLLLHRAFFEAGGARAVYAGTCAEYDWSFDRLDEQATPLSPATLYGASKAATWTMLDHAARLGGQSVAWGRVFFLYGPGEARGRLVSDVIASSLLGRAIDCSAGTQERDFMHVDDVARAFVELLLSDVTGPVNIASGECRPVRDVLAEVVAQTKRPDLVRIGARPVPASDPPRLAASAGRLAEEVGFKPTYTLRSGVADTVAWWRAEIGERGLVDGPVMGNRPDAA